MVERNFGMDLPLMVNIRMTFHIPNDLIELIINEL